MKNGQFPEVINLGDLNGQNGFKLDGENNQDWSGYSVSAAGDINGDGVGDGERSGGGSPNVTRAHRSGRAPRSRMVRRTVRESMERSAMLRYPVERPAAAACARRMCRRAWRSANPRAAVM